MTTLSSVSNLQGWRAGLLWFPDPQNPKAQHETDGLLVTGQSANGIVRIPGQGLPPSGRHQQGALILKLVAEKGAKDGRVRSRLRRFATDWQTA